MMACYTFCWLLLRHRGGASRAHRKAPAARAGAFHFCSVFLGQQQCRDRSVSLSNDPQCLSLAHAIAAQKSKALFETQFVFGLVILAKIAPVASQMAREELQ